MSAPFERPVLRAVAEIILDEERQRIAADRELAGDLARAREKIDEYGNVIANRFVALDHMLTDTIAAKVAAIKLEPGAPGAAGAPGEPGQEGRQGPPGERGAPGEAIQGPPGERGDPGQEGRQGPPGERGEPGEAIQGPPGEPGQEGRQGPPGERGEPGPPGPVAYTGRAMGRHNPAVRYRAMDVAAHNGSEWRAVVDDPGALPGDGWVIGAKGVKGDKGLPGQDGKEGPRGERGLPGMPGPPGKDGRGIDDIQIDNGVLIFILSDGQRKEFAIEVAP